MIRKWMQPISRDRRNEVLEELNLASSPGFDYFLLVMLSASIATFGLITDSAAVIIGAMLVAPLMSPILGLSLASIVAEERIFERALLALIEGILLALVLSIFWAWLAQILPFDFLASLPSEVQARTHPSPFDLGIALAGGAAASYALAQPRLSAALPGVAIATALMPPVCTAGIGIAIGHWDVAYGAALLFVTNLASISFAGILVFVALGFRPKHRDNGWHRLPRSLVISAVLVLLVTVPLVLLTLQVVKQARFSQLVQSTVANEIKSLPDAQLLEVSVDQTSTALKLSVTILTTRQPTYEQVVGLQERIALQLNQPTALQLVVVPGTQLDPLFPPTRTPTLSFTQTITPSPSATVTLTPTFTPTPTQTFTPTPILAYIANTGGKGALIYASPDGQVLTALSQGAPVHILYNREFINGLEWVEIRLPNDSVGWVPAKYVVIRP